MTESLEDCIEKQKVFSRLMDFLNGEGKKIEWRRNCWRDGRDYSREELEGHLDDEFSVTNYFASLMLGEITLDFVVDWQEKVNDRLSLRFTKWARLGLEPKPEDIVLFYKNSYFEDQETSKRDIPIYQARYNSLFGLHFDEARVAMNDFVERGRDLAQYFTGMQDKPKERFYRLIERFKEFRDAESVIRIS